MAHARQVIHIRPQAPAKPALGAPCNGCGVCCLAEPCPVGMVLSRRRQGACVALRWHDAGQRYQCGALVGATERLALARPWQRPWRWIVWRWMRRMIAAGQGCDASYEVGPAPKGYP
jgi:hypothetical protein